MVRWIVFGVIALIAGGVWLWSEISQADRDSTGEVTGKGTESVMDVRVGDCVVDFGLNDSDPDTTDASVTLVPCNQPHRYEVFAADSSAFASLAAFNRNDFSEYGDPYCYEEFESYTGTAWEFSGLEYSFLFPTKESWASGDRGITCILHLEDLTLWQGSYRG